jgi:hypothetical protein
MLLIFLLSFALVHVLLQPVSDTSASQRLIHETRDHMQVRVKDFLTACLTTIPAYIVASGHELLIEQSLDLKQQRESCLPFFHRQVERSGSVLPGNDKT